MIHFARSRTRVTGSYHSKKNNYLEEADVIIYTDLL